MTTQTITPTIVLMIAGSYMTRTESGEIVETVDTLPDGTPDWENAGICDARGAGGGEGYGFLRDALGNAEENAKLVGVEVTRLP